jgi:hypothetical protein
MGRVRSITRKNAAGKKIRGRVMRPSINKLGYARVNLWLDKKRTTFGVHVLVLMAFRGPRPEGHVACHFPDASPGNNKLTNLSWGTPKENQAHRDIHGNTARAESHGMARLGWDDVREIRELAASGVIYREIGRRKGVTKHQIYHVVSGKQWKERA